MPTLIRLLGDSAKNNTEVRNAFKEPVFIPANARVALTGLNAVLVDDIATEAFVISGQTGEFKIGIASTNATQQPLAIIPNGDYTAAGFVDAFEIAANYTGLNDNREALLGLHHLADIVDGKLKIQTYQGQLADAGFNEAGTWFEGGGLAPAASSATGFTATATVSSFTELANLNGRIPLVSSRFAATFVNADTVDMQITAVSYADPEVIYWGIRVLTVGGQRQYQAANRVISELGVRSTVWTNLGAAYAQANDVIELDRFGESVRIKITRSGGAQAYNGPVSGIVRELTDQSKDTIVWLVKANTGGQMSGCQCTNVDGLDPLSRLLNTNVNASLQFITAASAFNTILAMYCGFPSERNPIVYRGDPAVLNSRFTIGGIPGYPGVLVTLDGLGLIKSHDGAATAKSPANIVYSVNELQDKTQYLQLDIPELLYLDVGNPAPINVNELRVRLFESGGYNPLTFIGKPSFSFIIDYPADKKL
jgi:hypothetical protein